MAEAAVLGDLSVAMLFLGWLLPLGPVLMALAVAPMAALAARRRPRAVIAAGLASSSVAFLLGGATLWSLALVLALIGMAIGAAIRRSWGWLRLIGAALPIWAAVAGVTVSQLFLFANLRKLAFDQIHNSWNGARNVMRHIPGTHGIIVGGNHVVPWVIRYWWGVIPVALLLGIEGATVLAAAISRPAIRRVERALGAPAPDVPLAAHEGTPGPVPVRLSDVAYRYPGAESWALSEVDIEIPDRALVAVTGLNGSGKSTLARVVAGLVDAEGEVTRPAGVALGRPGGTAVIFQRPESQVLGIRLRDDITWGMNAAAARAVDVSALLVLVGLEGMEDEETATLSGGQLQRLAIAAALARRPALLVSDESTSMLDPAGRRQVADLLVRVVKEQGVTVLHVTHRREEAARADVLLSVSAGHVSAGEAPAGGVAVPAGSEPA